MTLTVRHMTPECDPRASGPKGQGPGNWWHSRAGIGCCSPASGAQGRVVAVTVMAARSCWSWFHSRAWGLACGCAGSGAASLLCPESL